MSARRNLWKSKTEENKYARELRGFVNQYGQALQDALQRASHTSVDGTVTVDLAAFTQEMNRIESMMISQNGTAITKQHAKDAMLLGVKYSDKTLRDEGAADA